VQAPHILLGMLANPRTKGAQALQHAGLTYEGVLPVVTRMYERRADADGPQSMAHEAGMLLRGAQREARALQHEFIGTAHLALACTRDGVTSIGPIVAGRERMIRSAACGLLARADRLHAATAASQDTDMEALEHALDPGERRATLERDLHQGRTSMEELLLDPPDFLRTAKVFDLLVSLPRVGRARVGNLLAQCAISPGGTLGSLSSRQRHELRRAL
jgi:ATP-dependent Clp protease ATP-binding subunit ClpA